MPASESTALVAIVASGGDRGVESVEFVDPVVEAIFALQPLGRRRAVKRRTLLRDFFGDFRGRRRRRYQSVRVEQGVNRRDGFRGRVDVGVMDANGGDGGQNRIEDAGCVEIEQRPSRRAERKTQRRFEHVAQIRQIAERQPTSELCRGFARVIRVDAGIRGEHSTVDAMRFDDAEQHARQRRHREAQVKHVEIGFAHDAGFADHAVQCR